MTKFLIKESPMLIFPSLAMKIGFREAVILQQIHFWLTSSLHIIEGRRWIYNTYKDWHKQFPFWSEVTIKRSILSLERKGLLISGNWNFSKIDKTKWYTIDYEKVANLELPLFEDSEAQPCLASTEDGAPAAFHTAQMVSSADPAARLKASESRIEEINRTRPIPESTSKNTSEKEKHIVDIIDYLNHKTYASYKPTTGKTQKIIQARLKEGFTVADFKQVIDLKTAEWLHDPEWSKYLRPETLFGTKFESYLNQKGFKKKITEMELNLDD